MKTEYKNVEPYITKDGSEIRELIHPDSGNSINQSLAEATVKPGQTTQLHIHKRTEEIYHITIGRGLMTLGNSCFEVSYGDSVLIPAGTPHKIKNSGDHDLKILCVCSPAYSNEDTELL